MGIYSSKIKNAPKSDKKLKDIIIKYSENDPFFIRKCLISHYFNISLEKVNNNLSFDEIEKYYNAAIFLIDTVDMAPYKTNK